MSDLEKELERAIANSLPGGYDGMPATLREAIDDAMRQEANNE